MNCLRTAIIAVSASAVFAGMCRAEEGTAIKLEPKGYASLECGQIVKGYDKHVGNIENVFVEKVYTGFGLDVLLSPQTKLIAALEMKMFNEFPRMVELGATRRLYFYPYLTQAELSHTFMSNDKWGLKVGGGYFPYKYNKDVRNLGEYLFRSTAYPQTLTTEFDYPFARLAGAYLRGAVSEGVSKVDLDVLVTTNTEWMAVHDVNLSCIATYSLARIFEIGLGASFCSIISVDPNATAPKDGATQYLNYEDTTLSVVDKDTLNYTFAGTKLMARYSFDPKRFFTSGFFGEQDLKIYGEAALLGVKNYPVALSSPIWYMSRLERIPVMIGFNWPTNPLVVYTGAAVPEFLSYFTPDHSIDAKEMKTLLITGGAGIAAGAGTWFLEKFLSKKLRLDVLSIEAEWWGNRYPNNMEGIVIDGLPIPFRAGTSLIDSMLYKGDNWKWSIYGRKTIAGHYQVTFQAASDHIRTFALDWNRQDWEESLRSPASWYYVLKFGVLF